MINDDILTGIQKPGRYIGQEWNVSRKEFDKAAVKFALCFPDMYEVGMSNLGIRIIYGLLNRIPDVVCERFFSVGTDLEQALRSQDKEIFSLESKKSLKEFDIIGFSLGSELDYTNVLNVLDLGKIPLEASERDGGYPLVIGGGPATLNPEPMHAFFDLFVIGEAEEALVEIIDIFRKGKSSINKQDLLLKLSQVEGVYVPSLYKAPLKIKKRFIRDLDNSYFPTDWLVPYIQVIHDRMTLEIARGCPNRCRFCQARSGYYPYRARSVEKIMGLARETYERTGYEEISLCGLSVSDYLSIGELSKNLIDLFKERAVSVSLPSVKPKTMLGDISSLIATIKKTGLTFAPEAGSSRLRQLIAKDFDEQDFFKTLEEAYASGYQRVKLYFMIGLPEEGEKDLEGIIDLAVQVSELRRKTKKGPAYINISANTLIPKPHTPLQWMGMEMEEGIRYKQDFLKNRAKNRRLSWNFHDPKMSLLEGVLARGDRKLSSVIRRAFVKGCRFDAWSNFFAPDLWKQSFEECAIDPKFYLRAKPIDAVLPWDFIDVGINKENLIAEFNKVIAIK